MIEITLIVDEVKLAKVARQKMGNISDKSDKEVVEKYLINYCCVDIEEETRRMEATVTAGNAVVKDPTVASIKK